MYIKNILPCVQGDGGQHGGRVGHQRRPRQPRHRHADTEESHGAGPRLEKS